MEALEKFSHSNWIRISASCIIFRFKSNDSNGNVMDMAFPTDDDE